MRKQLTLITKMRLYRSSIITMTFDFVFSSVLFMKNPKIFFNIVSFKIALLSLKNLMKMKNNKLTHTLNTFYHFISIFSHSYKFSSELPSHHMSHVCGPFPLSIKHIIISLLNIQTYCITHKNYLKNSCFNSDKYMRH